MRRRAFITLLGGAAAWPLTARAQQPVMPVVGFLSTGAPQAFANVMDRFREGLGEQGYVEGKNVVVEFSPALDEPQRFPMLAADLVRRRVAVIVASGGTAAALAAKGTTATVPIVFQMDGDPVTHGLVVSLNQPGGNVTGFTRFGTAIAAKRFGLLGELVPQAEIIAVLMNANNPDTKSEIAEVVAAAAAIGRQTHVAAVAELRELDKALEEAVQRGARAVYVASDAYFSSQRDQMVVLAGRHAIPASYDRPEYVAAGGLMSYASNRAETWRQMGTYVGRILKGTRPNDLPVLQPTRFELVINLRTARALGLEIPPTLLARADEVIE